MKRAFFAFLLILAAPVVAQSIDGLAQACKGGDTFACAQGAALARQTLDADRDFFFVKNGCAQRDANACAKLGVFYRMGVGTKQNYKLSHKHSSFACKAGIARACLQVGFLHNEGQGLARSKPRAQQYYDKACALGLPEHLQMVC